MKVKVSALKKGPSSYGVEQDQDMQKVLELCKRNRWDTLLHVVRADPSIALKHIVMNNRLTTTILHQSIYAKGHQELRAKIIRSVLKNTPKAASIPNGFGSLPIHVIAQRNTNFSATTKEALIHELADAYPPALLKSGGKGKRTPLHILFTDYVSLDLAKELVQKGKSACFMKDKKGFLPIHVACSRHCSPDKLELLLEVNPNALYAKTNDGSTPLSLAQSTATKSHPNFTLILQLKKDLARAGKAQTTATLTNIPVPVSPEPTRCSVSHRTSGSFMSDDDFSEPSAAMMTTRTRSSSSCESNAADALIANVVLSLCESREESLSSSSSPSYIHDSDSGTDKKQHPTDKAADLLMHLSHSSVHEV